MSSTKTLTPPLGEEVDALQHHKMERERPTGQLFELQDLQKKQITGLASFDEEESQVRPPPPPSPGPPPGAPPPPVPPTGGERGLREFNYNGRDVKPRNSERSSGVMGRRRISSYSMYSGYSSYEASDDGRGDAAAAAPAGGVAGGDSDNGGGGSGEVPQAEHVERLAKRTPDRSAIPPPLRTGSRATRNRGLGPGGGVVVKQPPPIYAPSQEYYNRVRFADEERLRREEEDPAGPRRIEMSQIAGGHSASALWVFACCAFFWYRCLMDEDF
ncbi:hypothetical protein C8035_v006958 [Colletotrichum spinosum]|uniref:Uncharacterized protein n=1 Tax=Colletotrichum spinosum TaxID=1347390 RepID=A0A4R8QJ12_9PEZI|nr:hypothetical protein C8035_v006958 [Colletotrichum spinosum]